MKKIVLFFFVVNIFIIIFSLSFDIITPNGNENFIVGNNMPVHWRVIGSSTSSRLEYSIDGGANWIVVVNSTQNDGDYLWTIPNNPSTTCKVRISNPSDPNDNDVSDTFFVISRPEIFLRKPLDNEILIIGENFPIHWDWTGSFSNVKLEYSTDGGTNWSSISNSTTNDGEYLWSIPNYPSNNCKIRITNTSDPNSFAITENSFTIANNSLTIISPNGGENLVTGKYYPVHWNWSGSFSNVKLEYSADSGNIWSNITTSTVNDGSYNWLIPSINPSNKCMLKITNAANPEVYDITDMPFSIVQTSLTLLTPNGGETFVAGTKTNISWDWEGSISNVKLEYSTDGGTNWTSIVSSVTNEGTYLWTVPNVSTTNLIIRVSNVNDPASFDVSNSVSNIIPSQIDVKFPNGNEQLVVGQSYPISWNWNGNFSNVKIEYSTNNGLTWSVIKNSDPNDGSYVWTVPNTPSNQSLIKVSDASNSSVYDISNAAFTIKKPALKVIKFNGNDTIIAANRYPILWESEGTISNVAIEYSTNSGSNWSTIISSTTNDGSYIWTAPDVNSNSCLLKITNVDDITSFDISDTTFSINSPSIQLIQPVGGESLKIGTKVPILWSYNSDFSSVNIDYSSDGGVNWNSIATLESNDGSYVWSIPSTFTPSSTYRIRVRNSSDNNSYSISSDFTLVQPYINIISPDSGKVFISGEKVSINYTFDGSFPNIKIEYSTDNGTTWNVITNSTTNSGTYLWTLPTLNSDSCLIKILNLSDSLNSFVISKRFSIQKPTFIIKSPKINDSLIVGNVYPIVWENDGEVTNVKIEYSTDNGVTYTTIASSVLNEGTYNWTVPSTVSSTVLIKVSNAADLSNYGISSIFNIIAPIIEIIKPNGGESIIAGDYYPVEWNWTGNFSYVKFEYSTDSGSTWTKILNSDTLNDGSFLWSVPSNATTTNALFRISNNLDPVNTFDLSSSTFTINSPSVTIISPNGGEVLIGGEIYPIRWRNEGNFSNVKIEYSIDGVTWTLIDATDPNDGVFNWTVPSIVSTNVKVRITSTTDAATTDVSDSTFSIVSPSIELVSPNGGETFISGDIMPIHWKNNGSVSTVKIEYSVNDGATWNTIVSSTTNNGYYRWTIPALIVSDSTRIKVTSTSDSLTTDISNNRFSIKRPTITLKTPNGFENLIVGEYIPIHWENDGKFSNVKIEYSTDGGSIWKNISTTEINDGNYIWKVPNDVSATCKVKISNISDNNSFDISDSNFIIQKPTVSIFSPDSAQSLIVGNKYPIYWNWTGNVDSVIIELYYKVSGLVQSSIISTATLNTGTYIFTVPNNVSDSCWIKITSTASDSVYSLSKIFSIVRPIYMIVQPNGGENYYPGEKSEFNWNSIGGPDIISLFYSIDGGLNYTLIKNTQNIGSYLWQNPFYSFSTYKIRVMSSTDNYAFDESDTNFTVLNPTINIDQPVLGDICYNSNYFPIYTTNRGILTSDSIQIHIQSKFLGDTNLGKFPVREYYIFKDTFFTQNDTIQVKIYDKDGSYLFDTSDNIPVVAQPTVDTILFPNQTDTMYVDETYYIVWNSLYDTTYKVSLYYSTDGLNFISLKENQKNHNYLDFTLPHNSSSNNFTLKVDFYDSSNVYQTSLSVNNLVVKKPVIEILYPDNFDSLFVGRKHNIIWRTVKGNPISLQIYYNTDGITWKEIKSQVSDTGSYLWTIPNEPTSNAIIRIEEYGDTLVRALSESFVIKPQRIFITSPLVYDTFISGRSYDISWYNLGVVDSVNIYYSVDGGNNWSFITKKVNDYSYRWTLPNFSTDTALIKVEYTKNSNVFDISDTFTIIPQRIYITYPDSSTLFYSGNRHYITWKNTGLISNVKITYSSDNGKNWNVITNSTSNAQNYLWTVPQIYSDSVLIKIANVDDTTQYDISKLFKILPQIISVTYPLNGSGLISGKEYNITWVYKGLFDTAIVEYSTNNGSTWNTLGKTLNSNRYYLWRTPNVRTDSSLIRIVNKDNVSVNGYSSSFSILDKYINITSPKSGDQYIVGERCMITFDFLGSPNDSVIVSYSSDDGVNWAQIDTIPASRQYLEWIVPNVISSDCYIKLTCLNLTSSSILSEKFSIVPQTITVNSPISTSQWISGRKYYITWNNTGNFSNVDIDYSINSGSTWQSIVSTSNLKYYLWTIPNLNSSNSLIRVKNSLNSTVFAQSPLFSINYPTVDVIFPSSADTFYSGKYYHITWYSNMASSDSVVISYSKDGGLSYTIVDTVQATLKYFKWRVPEGGSTNCIIKINGYETSQIEGVSEVFVIKEQQIFITYPLLNDTLKSLNPFYITWDYTGFIDSLIGEYSLDNGSTWTTFSSSIPALNQYYLFNPFPLSNTDNALIRLTNKNNSTVNRISSTFSLKYPQIEINNPSSGSMNVVGSKVFITWNNEGIIDTVNLYYSTDNGNTYNSIASSIKNNGYYEWIIPNYVSDSCLIKISYTSNETLFDLSERFSLIPQTLEIFYPSFKDSFMITKICPITWFNNGTIGNVMIEYSLDGGSIWNTITNSTTNNKFYEWTLPTTLVSTDNTLLRVRNVSNLNVYDISDTFKIVPQKIQITYPDSNSQMIVTRKYFITWITTGTISNVNIYYTLDGGTTWNSLVSNISNTGYYEWTVPDVNSNLVRIRITNANNENIFDDSETFSIVPQLILVNSPKLTDRWIVGRKYYITWSNIGTISKIRLEYSYDDGLNWNMVVDNLTNANNYKWTIPNTPSENCYVKISNYDNTNVYTTSERFAIPLQNIEVLSPKSTDMFISGRKYYITWKNDGTVSNVDIQYSKDNGATWTYIVTGASNNGYYEWTVPTENYTECIVRILDSNNNNVFGISDRFIILPQEITITSPSVFDTLIAGRKYYITWRTTGIFSTCDIFYSTDLGSQWRSIASGVSNSGHYEWSVPDIAVSDKALVKISNSSQSTIYGTSDTFVISKPILNFTSPVSGNVFETTKKYYFTWTTLGTILQYNLEISYDNGQNWSQIIANQNNLGNYEWTAPYGVYSDSCILKLTSSSNSSIFYYSDLFSLVSYSNVDDIFILKNKNIKYFNLKVLSNYNNENIVFEVPVDCYSSISIYDVTGRNIKRVYEGKISMGTHVFPLKDSITKKGIYFIKVKSFNNESTLYEKTFKLFNVR